MDKSLLYTPIRRYSAVIEKRIQREIPANVFVANVCIYLHRLAICDHKKSVRTLYARVVACGKSQVFAIITHQHYLYLMPYTKDMYKII